MKWWPDFIPACCRAKAVCDTAHLCQNPALREGNIVKVRHTFVSLTAALAVTQAAALSLGAGHGLAVLGAPLDLSFTVHSTDGSPAHLHCPAAEVIVGGRQVHDGRITLTSVNASTLRLQVDELLREPQVKVVLSAGCTGRVQRGYTFLAQLPTRMAGDVPVTQVPAPVTASSVRVDASMPARAARSVAASAAASASAAGEQAQSVAQMAAPAVPSAPPPLPALPSVPQVTTAPALPESPGAVAQPELAPETASPAQHIQALAPVEPPVQTLPVQEPVAQPLAPAVPVPPPAAPAPVLSQTDASGAQAMSLVQALQEEIAPWMLALLLALLLGLLLLVRRRAHARMQAGGPSPSGEEVLAQARAQQSARKAARATPVPVPPPPPAVSAGKSPVAAGPAVVPPPAAAAASATAALPAAATPAAGGAVAVARPAAPAQPASAPAAALPAAPVPAEEASEEAPELGAVLKEAEFQAAMGQHDRAIAALTHYITTVPDASAVAHVELLKTLHHLGRSLSFEQERRKFETLFAVTVPTFGQFAESGSRALCDTHPDLLQRITALWPQPEVQDLLLSLVLPIGSAQALPTRPLLPLGAFRDLLTLHQHTSSVPQQDWGAIGSLIRLEPLPEPAPAATAPAPARRPRADVYVAERVDTSAADAAPDLESGLDALARTVTPASAAARPAASAADSLAQDAAAMLDLDALEHAMDAKEKAAAAGGGSVHAQPSVAPPPPAPGTPAPAPLKPPVKPLAATSASASTPATAAVTAVAAAAASPAPAQPEPVAVLDEMLDLGSLATVLEDEPPPPAAQEPHSQAAPVLAADGSLMPELNLSHIGTTAPADA